MSETTALATSGRAGKAGYWVTVEQGAGPRELKINAHISQNPQNWPAIGILMRQNNVAEAIAMATNGIRDHLDLAGTCEKRTEGDTVVLSRTLTYDPKAHRNESPAAIAQVIADEPATDIGIGVEGTRMRAGGKV